ncbi:cytochrome P460 family protein [Coralloluteibacterium stylophorae]|uniref:Cytochrome P460 family protein n=1 Tax=Coralloluteibacterium stylophorae TaxID=1776034 RepID=A0A8J7VRQ9_9GAMM|nr:cytochrome P460 family protein [Coralloluteibacterium stylophorae]MBS7455781.1 cytochrome P460 family protein [Coralloluteibacterium stylophorae]
MKPILAALSLAALVPCLVAGAAAVRADAGRGRAAPVYGVELPEGYRQWPLVAPAQEAAPLDELRVVLGNPVALRAYGDGTRPFPDGTVLVKLAWTHVPSPDFEPASVPGAATTVQVMVKDSRRYGDTGGWGYGRFVAGRPVDEAQHRTCHACHAARVADRDYVFTRLAP